MRARFSPHTSRSSSPIPPPNPPPPPLLPPSPPSPSQQIEIVQLLPVPQNVPPDLAPVHPRHDILHVPRHQERRVRHHLRAHPDVPLLHEPDRRRHVVRHAQPRHHDAEAPPREAGDADFPLHVAEFGRGGEDAHVVEF